MLSKVVVNLYSVLLEVGLWLCLLVGLVGGWQGGGVLGAIVGVIGAAIFGAVVFGAFLVLDDIRKKVDTIKIKSE
ncbi:hypothetical protein ACKVMY_05895 [Vibrio natriegens]|uniref:hypothetical protein n=1 Tax=Vibrio natriegens TaxID=691 RepID=UPI0008044558|nr:hypothetical protein [Vibrio natriegens]ANQ19922.1 hypothetical protein BA891_22475 [Vibrio natriegens]